MLCELKRILTNKRYVLSILLVILINLIFFQYQQASKLELLHTIDDNYIIEEWKNNQVLSRDKFYENAMVMEMKAEELSQISIFANENSFSNKNIFKTLNDYEKISTVDISTTYSDQAITSLLEYKGINLLSFLIIFITILSFFDERKAGLWQIVFSCKHGRAILATKRLFTLGFITILSTLCMVFSTLVLAFYNYGGIGILRCSAQSCISLQSFTL